MIWLGDFNRHHPAWDDPANFHLFTRRNVQRADILIAHIADLGLEMALPPTIPTLEATRTKNLTRPDNVFCSEEALEDLHLCTTAPHLRPTCTDHFPILTTLRAQVENAVPPARPNFRDVDWDAFNGTLTSHLEAHPPPTCINNPGDLESSLDRLTDALRRAVEEHVPKMKPTPFVKRWWSKELTDMRKEKERLEEVRQDVRREAGFEEALGREVRMSAAGERRRGGEEERGKGGFEAAVKDGLQEFGEFLSVLSRPALPVD